MDFNVAGHKKFTAVVSDSTWKTLRNYYLSSFSVILKKNIYNLLKRLLKSSLCQLHICVNLDLFLYTSKEHIQWTDPVANMKIQLSVLSQIL